MTSLKDELNAMVLKLAYRKGKFTLASGKESDFYIDIKNLSLHPQGASLIGKCAWEALNPKDYAGVGGPTLGADPIATALSLAALSKGVELPAFIIRKEPKKYGRSLWIEGSENIDRSKNLLVIEDVVTTGGSSVKAIERIREEGFKVDTLLAVMDRGEGGKESLEKIGVRLVALTTIDQIHKLS